MTLIWFDYGKYMPQESRSLLQARLKKDMTFYFIGRLHFSYNIITSILKCMQPVKHYNVAASLEIPLPPSSQYTYLAT